MEVFGQQVVAAAGCGGARDVAACLRERARFPQSKMTFRLADSCLVALVPSSARYVGGFARAFTLTPEELGATLRE